MALATAFASEGQGPLPSTRTVHLQPFVTCHKTSQGNERLKSADSQGQTRTPGVGGGQRPWPLQWGSPLKIRLKVAGCPWQSRKGDQTQSQQARQKVRTLPARVGP